MVNIASIVSTFWVVFTDGIVSGNESGVKEVASWLAGTDVEAALNGVMDAEEQFEIAKLKLSAAKKQLAKAFRD